MAAAGPDVADFFVSGCSSLCGFGAYRGGPPSWPLSVRCTCKCHQLQGGSQIAYFCLMVVPATSRFFWPSAYRLYVKDSKAVLYGWLVPRNVTCQPQAQKSGWRRGPGKAAPRGVKMGPGTAPQAVMGGVLDGVVDGVETPGLERPPGAEGRGFRAAPGENGLRNAWRGLRGERSPVGPLGRLNPGKGRCGGLESRAGGRCQGPPEGVGVASTPGDSPVRCSGVVVPARGGGLRQRPW